MELTKGLFPAISCCECLKNGNISPGYTFLKTSAFIRGGACVVHFRGPKETAHLERRQANVGLTQDRPNCRLQAPLNSCITYSTSFCSFPGWRPFDTSKLHTLLFFPLVKVLIRSKMCLCIINTFCKLTGVPGPC